MAYSNTFNIIPAKPAFGSKIDTSESGYYTESKMYKAMYCNVLKCPQKIKVKNQSDLIGLKRARYLATLRCKLPYSNLALNNNLYTAMDMRGVCSIGTLGGDTCPNTRVNPSKDFYNSYVIDPKGLLFGNTQCGQTGYLRYRTIYAQYVKPPNQYVGSGYELSFQDPYYIFTFKGNGNISFSGLNITINYLIVGGGGGGGSAGSTFTGSGGGGGGGQVQYGTINNITQANLSITVGNGGAGGLYDSITDTSTSGSNGGDTKIEGEINIISAGGKGGQTGYYESDSGYVWGNGGKGGNSGAGGAGGIGGYLNVFDPFNDIYYTGGNGVNGGGGGGEGNNQIFDDNYYYGYSGNGANNTLVNPSFMNNIDDYGAGGGGGFQYYDAELGVYVGGQGGKNAGSGGTEEVANGTDALPNFGGGGGGGRAGFVSDSYIAGNAGSGGSGVVILYVVL
jgi:hypothetical protein